MLATRAYLGELHVGDVANVEAHEPIVDVDTWQRVQRVRIPAGRKAKSDYLLAAPRGAPVWFLRWAHERDHGQVRAVTTCAQRAVRSADQGDRSCPRTRSDRP